jgi:hypothetical protein
VAIRQTYTDEMLLNQLDNAMNYLIGQEERLRPFIEQLEQIMLGKIDKEDISLDTAFDMYLQMQKQYTESILLITKVKEIMRFK